MDLFSSKLLRMRTLALLASLPAVAIFARQSSGRRTYHLPLAVFLLSWPFLLEYTLVWLIKGNKDQYNSTHSKNKRRKRVAMAWFPPFH
uniref:Uncharacterized protein n=1 Tax=Ixodes ricinus TaxID=34613 RepID=A0A6B0UG57_IXORI